METVFEMDGKEFTESDWEHKGHDICTITGCCIKMLNFSDKEYVTNMQFYMDRGAPECSDHEEEENEEEEDAEQDQQRNKRHEHQEVSTSLNKKNRYRSW